ncbi:hypothetical protein Tco_1193488 [Tanacetum coccineum]
MVDDQPMWGNNQAIAPTPRVVIIAVDLRDNFTIKGHHLSMIKDRQFDGRSRADLHKYIAEFVKICGMFRYGTTNSDAIKLKLSPSYFPGVPKYVQRTKPRCYCYLGTNETSFRTIIQIFYHGLDEATQAILDAKGIFIYKTLNKAHQLLEDRVLLKLDWSKDMKAKPIRKTVAFAESSNDSKLMQKMEAVTTKIDSQFKDIKGEMKEMRDGCNSCGGPHPSLDCDDQPIGGPKDEEANYAYGGYRGGGYRGNYYGRSSRNWQYHQPRDGHKSETQPQKTTFCFTNTKKKFQRTRLCKKPCESFWFIIRWAGFWIGLGVTWE